MQDCKVFDDEVLDFNDIRLQFPWSAEGGVQITRKFEWDRKPAIDDVLFERIAHIKTLLPKLISPFLDFSFPFLIFPFLIPHLYAGEFGNLLGYNRALELRHCGTVMDDRPGHAGYIPRGGTLSDEDFIVPLAELNTDFMRYIDNDQGDGGVRASYEEYRKYALDVYATAVRYKPFNGADDPYSKGSEASLAVRGYCRVRRSKRWRRTFSSTSSSPAAASVRKGTCRGRTEFAYAAM